MPPAREYIIFETHFAHPAISLVEAESIDDAIEVFCQSNIARARKFRNGRWRCGGEYFDSARELLASTVDVSCEVKRFDRPRKSRCEEVFAGIDWWSIVYEWKDGDFYMRPMRKIGKFYEWYSPRSDYYAIFPSPKFLLNKLKANFGDAFDGTSWVGRR